MNQIVNGQIAVGAHLPGERELARQMRISPMTVSRALNELVSEGFLRREPGVGTFVISDQPTPEPSRSPRVHVVFFVRIDVPFIEHDVFFGPLLQGLSVQGARRNCEFRYVWANEQRTLKSHLLQLDPEQDRLILVAPAISRVQEVVQAVAESAVPYVVVAAHWPNTSLRAVDVDNQAGAAMAVNHLWELGHRRIALLYMWPDTANTRDRIQGYRQAMAQRGLPVHEEWLLEIRESDRVALTAQAKIQQLLSVSGPAGQRPTAVVAAGHWLALATLQAAAAMGLEVPNDLSVVGFDDTVAAAFVNPPLTTVRQPLFELGQTALDRVLALPGPSADRSDQAGSKGDALALLQPELICRHSTARAREASA